MFVWSRKRNSADNRQSSSNPVKQAAMRLLLHLALVQNCLQYPLAEGAEFMRLPIGYEDERLGVNVR